MQLSSFCYLKLWDYENQATGQSWMRIRIAKSAANDRRFVKTRYSICWYAGISSPNVGKGRLSGRFVCKVSDKLMRRSFCMGFSWKSLFRFSILTSVLCGSTERWTIAIETARGLTENSGVVSEASGTVPSGPAEANLQESHSRAFPVERVFPRWFPGSEDFWYQVQLPNGVPEFIIVRPEVGERKIAFDVQTVQSKLKELVGETPKIEWLSRDGDTDCLLLVSRSQVFRWCENSQVLEIDSRRPSEIAGGDQGQGITQQAGQETSIVFKNTSDGPVEILWLSGRGVRKSYGIIPAGEEREQHTFGGHRWGIYDADGKLIKRVTANDFGLHVTMDSMEKEAPNDAIELIAPSIEPHISKDGNWRWEVRDGVLLCQNTADGKEFELDKAEAGHAFSGITWAPNSNHVIAFQKKLVEKEPIFIVRSSPPEGGRARLERIPYALPGDPFPTYELRIYDVERQVKILPEVDRFEHEWNQPSLSYSEGGASFCYEIIDRGHQRYRLVRVNIKDGSVSTVIDEKSDTFIWTAHAEVAKLPRITWIAGNRELLFTTERSGWRQLLRLDATTGKVLNELTPTGLVLRSIERVDEDSRKVWFSASGREGQDPYHIHYGFVSLESGEIVWETEGDGTHSITYSPSRKYLIDSYSRVDSPPTTVLRDSESGRLIRVLEETDLSAWRQSGGRTDEVFVAKGRDGETDIWGIICRPREWVPGKKYPVLEDIYAGPHGSFVPKNFSRELRYKELTDLGFIVVKIDGMGTANRSKAFHDVCWKNIKDAGFEDRILWMKAAAEKYPELDLSRVGIYGVSAGGQNAAAALLFHPDFYKVGVAGCGCHDNRMDKASWNEQWMGFPVGAEYSASSNIDNAHLLQGKLLLIVGEVDTNVPPESTLRFADALIRHDKEFDLLVVPNEGHGIGGEYGRKRMHRFFVEHLKPE